MILPYLHERKIYLNQIDPSHKWFYNVVEERDIGDGENQGDQIKRNYIFAFNFTRFEYDVYTERGILIREKKLKK